MAPVVPFLSFFLLAGGGDCAPDAIRALAHLSGGGGEYARLVSDSTRLPPLVSLLSHANGRPVFNSLSVLTNLASISDDQCRGVLDKCVVEGNIIKLLKHEEGMIREQVCRLLVVAAGGTVDRISTLVSMTTEMKTVVAMAKSDSRWDARKEAVLVLSNVAMRGNDDHVKALVVMEGVSSLCSALTWDNDDGMVLVSLRAISRVLDVGLQSGHEANFTQKIYETDGQSDIRSLTKHHNDEIRKLSLHIVNFRLSFTADRPLGEAANIGRQMTSSSSVDAKGFLSFDWMRIQKEL